jgi:hypothetical protein
MTDPPFRQVRAHYDEATITVYQAYSPALADAAVAAGRFVPPFRRGRMTWIKPSFLWMMYRCGWATKPGQERVLAVRMSRTGFAEALSMASLSHFDGDLYPDHDAWQRRKASSPVRVQWDPERDVRLGPLAWRSIQVGLGGVAAEQYVDEWVVGIDDITPVVADLREREPEERRAGLPDERPYLLPAAVAAVVGAS